VKYRRQGRVEAVTFHGQIICISNLALQRGPLLTALKSRVHYLGFEPNDEELAALMLDLAASGWPAKQPRLSPAECGQVAAFLIEEARRRDVPLDLRQLVDKAYPDYLQHRSGDTEVDWRDLVIASLEGQVVELRHTSTIRPTKRKEQKESEQELLRGCWSISPRGRLSWPPGNSKPGSPSGHFTAGLRSWALTPNRVVDTFEKCQCVRDPS
jgi:hypothetical protein